MRYYHVCGRSEQGVSVHTVWGVTSVKWYRVFLLVFVIGLANCDSPSMPRLPEGEEEEEPDSTKGGFVLPAGEEAPIFV